MSYSRRFPRFLLAALALLLGPLRGAEGTATGADLSPATVSYRPITTVGEAFVRWADEAPGEFPVRFEGVVIGTMPSGAFRLHDGEHGIFVTKAPAVPKVDAGDRVIVTGVLRRGGFSPWITPHSVTLAGRAPFPVAPVVDFNVLASGSADNQWVEIHGVVRGVSMPEPRDFAVLELGMTGGKLRVLVNYDPGADYASLVDAEVRISGVAAVNVNAQKQVVEPSFRVPGLSGITTVRAGEKNAFAQTLTPANRLLRFATGAAQPQHRVRTSGVVTRRLSDTMLFIRDGQVGLKIEMEEPRDLRPGDRVEVAGFPEIEDGTAVIEHAQVRRLAITPPPAPVTPTLSSLLDGTHNSNLVRTSARLVDWVRAGSSVTLVFQAGDQIFKGLLNLPASTELALPERNSLVDVTGICVISDLEDIWFYQPRSFLLLVAGLDDIELRQAPPWWTRQRLGRALAIVAGALLAVAAWVWLLRRQVRRSGAVIEQQARRTAALEERSRIARDLHDTLEQGLTGLSLQLKAMELDLADSSPAIRERLQSTRQMLRQIRTLARDAIRKLRPGQGSARPGSLGERLAHLAANWNRAKELFVDVQVTGPARPLPSQAEEHLLGIATEAVTNAVKHGRAGKVSISVETTDAGLRLQIADDGGGFDVEGRSGGEARGFGLIGMHERAHEVGGELSIQSKPGHGAKIILTLPLLAKTAGRKSWSPANLRAALRKEVFPAPRALACASEERFSS